MIYEAKQSFRRLNESGLFSFAKSQSEELKSSVLIDEHTSVLRQLGISRVCNLSPLTLGMTSSPTLPPNPDDLRVINMKAVMLMLLSKDI
jgi:hypothetical protein